MLLIIKLVFKFFIIILEIILVIVGCVNVFEISELLIVINV